MKRSFLNALLISIYICIFLQSIQLDLFAVELLNGHIYIHVDLGSGASKVRASRRRVDDGAWHDLTLRRQGRECKVSIDGQWNDFRTPGDSTQFELGGPVYLGGTGPAYSYITMPAAVWTATLRQGFIGCLRDLVMSNKPVDIAAFARQQDSGDYIMSIFNMVALVTDNITIVDATIDRYRCLCLCSIENVL